MSGCLSRGGDALLRLLHSFRSTVCCAAVCCRLNRRLLCRCICRCLPSCCLLRCWLSCACAAASEAVEQPLCTAARRFQMQRHWATDSEAACGERQRCRRHLQRSTSRPDVRIDCYKSCSTVVMQLSGAQCRPSQLRRQHCRTPTRGRCRCAARLNCLLYPNAGSECSASPTTAAPLRAPKGGIASAMLAPLRAAQGAVKLLHRHFQTPNLLQKSRWTWMLYFRNKKLEAKEADALRGSMECCDRCDASHNKKAVLLSLSCMPKTGPRTQRTGRQRQGKGDEDLFCQLSRFVTAAGIWQHAEPQIRLRRPRLRLTQSPRSPDSRPKLDLSRSDPHKFSTWI